MSKVSIVTDSASTIDSQTAEQFGITVVPLTVRIAGKTYKDEIDLDHEKLLLNMKQDRIKPEIIGPTADDFRRVYEKLTQHTNQIISIHSSSKLSSVFREARIASRDFLGRCDIMVMDSETLSLGQSILVKKAAQFANESTPLGEISRKIRGLIRRIYIVLITDTLDYLQYNHLISSTQAILGAMLDTKPFLAIEEGDLIPMEKVRGFDKAIDKLADFANEFTNINQLAILQSDPYVTDYTKMLQDQLDLPNAEECPILLYGPLLASKIGPEGMGLVVYEGKSPNKFLYY